MKICPNCKKFYNDNDFYCLCCNYRLEHYSNEQAAEDQRRRMEDAKANLPKCPTCQSTNIKKISDAKRVAHGLTFGLYSKTARSQFECLNCGYKW